MHRCEERRLRSVSSERKDTRTEYLEARKVYSKGVKKARRKFQFQKCMELEDQVGCPKKF